jgi:DNA-binding NarL/FixJ family response regulator
MKKIRIVMADDVDVVRLGVSALLSTVDDFEVVA